MKVLFLIQELVHLIQELVQSIQELVHLIQELVHWALLFSSDDDSIYICIY
jgi:hypothetical protein